MAGLQDGAAKLPRDFQPPSGRSHPLYENICISLLPMLRLGSPEHLYDPNGR